MLRIDVCMNVLKGNRFTFLKPTNFVGIGIVVPFYSHAKFLDTEPKDKSSHYCCIHIVLFVYYADCISSVLMVEYTYRNILIETLV